MDAVSDRLPWLAEPSSAPVRRSSSAHDQNPLTVRLTGAVRRVRAVPGAARARTGAVGVGAGEAGAAAGAAPLFPAAVGAAGRALPGPEAVRSAWLTASGMRNIA